MASPSRIVVRPPNWLGDAVMALPALGTIRQHFPQDHLTVAAVPAVAAIFREDTDAAPDAVIELPRTSRAAIARLEGEAFDIGILFPNSFGSAWQFWRAGIGERWGYARSGRGLLLTRKSRPSGPRGPHQSDYYRALVGGLGISCAADALPRIQPRLPSRERADGLAAQHHIAPGTRLLGVAPGAAYGQAKQWHPDRVAEAMRQVLLSRPVTAVIVGASHDREAARAIESWFRTHAPELGRRVVNLTGCTSLGALVALVARMSAFLSNDSGAMHLAAASGCPVVAVFGPTDERATRPLGHHTVMTASVFCRPCMLRECPIDHRCMTRVSSERVAQALIELIDAGHEGR